MSPNAESKRSRKVLAALALTCSCSGAFAGGGPLGIDSVVVGNANGVFQRRYQFVLQDVTPLLVVGTALWLGDRAPLGHTAWQATDALLLGEIATGGLKLAFTRARPAQTSDPNRRFQGAGHYSFPSGKVMEIAAAVTPFVLEYGRRYPAVWALELLPAYDAVARVKSKAHWQTDVLASFVIGTGIGWYAHERASSFSVGVRVPDRQS